MNDIQTCFAWALDDVEQCGYPDVKSYAPAIEGLSIFFYLLFPDCFSSQSFVMDKYRD
jgi:hypothetical protein